MILEVEAATDVGLRRAQNEDSHGEWIPTAADERNRRGALLVVADGMGGSRAGEVASRLAVDTVLRSYREATGMDPLEDLHRAVEAANRVVHDESATRPELAGMGTTCTAVVLRGADAYVAHVGDSRAYLIQDGAIRQLTRDHSLVAQLVREGQLTPEQARVDPRRNVVTRSVGVGAHVDIDAEHEAGVLRPGDTLLVCSDGLHGVVADHELQAAASSADLAQGCRDAIALANARGGPDNITVVMARLRAGDDDVSPLPGGRYGVQAGETGAAGAGQGRDRETKLGSAGEAEARASPGPPEEARDNREPKNVGERRRDCIPEVGALDVPDKEPEPDIPRPHWIREERRRSSASATMWLLLALIVLLVAILAMTVVVRQMGQNSKQLGAGPREARRV